MEEQPGLWLAIPEQTTHPSQMVDMKMGDQDAPDPWERKPQFAGNKPGQVMGGADTPWIYHGQVAKVLDNIGAGETAILRCVNHIAPRLQMFRP